MRSDGESTSTARSGATGAKPPVIATAARVRTKAASGDRTVCSVVEENEARPVAERPAQVVGADMLAQPAEHLSGDPAGDVS